MKHNAGINYNLAKKISDEAVAEWGAANIYPVLAEKFTEVLTNSGTSSDGKSFLIAEVKTSKK
jgi:hypothetical protein